MVERHDPPGHDRRTDTAFVTISLVGISYPRGSSIVDSSLWKRQYDASDTSTKSTSGSTRRAISAVSTGVQAALDLVVGREPHADGEVGSDLARGSPRGSPEEAHAVLGRSAVLVVAVVGGGDRNCPTR